jgi:hypothetical protein
MNIASAGIKPQLLPHLDSSQYSHEQKQVSESFSEVLAAAMNQRLAFAGGMPVAIGEDAVPFDARPIVGRAFVTALQVEVAPTGHTESAQPNLRTIDLPAFEAEPKFWQATPLVAPRIAALVSRPVTCTVTAPAPGGLPAGPAKAGVAQLIEPLAPARANREAVPEGAAAPATPPDAGKSEIGAGISLTLLADEVLVTVRGLDLSADEEEALAGEARSLLASSDFGGRPLRVVTLGRT